MRDTRQKKFKRTPSPVRMVAIDGFRYYDVGEAYSGSALLKTNKGDIWIYLCDKWHQENNHMSRVA